MQTRPDVLAFEGMRLRTLITDRLRDNEAPTTREIMSSATQKDRGVADKVAAMTSVFRKPSLESARRTRMEAAQAVGLEDKLRCVCLYFGRGGC